MSKRIERDKAITLRLKGFSYSQIQNEIKVAKGTLSAWLSKYPLTDARIRELRDTSLIRIEKCRQTKARKKEERLHNLYIEASHEVNNLNEREIFIAGLFLYWGEGTKSAEYTTALTNTDPDMLLFYLKWLDILKVPKNKLKVKLHLYSEMDEDKEKKYWSNLLGIPLSSFRKTYIKHSKLSSITYKNNYNHGTCSILYDNRETYEHIRMCLKYVKNLYNI
jgi:hypothetical protein